MECFYDKTSEYKQWRELFEIKGTVKEAGEIVSRDLNFEDTRADSIKGKTIALLISLSSLTTLIFQVYEIYETTILILIVPKIITALVLLVTSLIATGVLASGIISRKIPRNLLRKEAKSSIKRIGNSIEIIDSSIDEIENDYKYFRRKED